MDIAGRIPRASAAERHLRAPACNGAPVITSTKSILERAFELAREGADLSEIRRALNREGYSQVNEHTTGRSIVRQLHEAGAAMTKRPPPRVRTE
jgi:hypothetical protein